MKTVYRNLLVYSLCIGLVFAPVHYARAIFPAIGSVVTAVVGATVVEAGTQAVVNVVAGKSPWGASDNVFGGKVKIPIKSIGDWVKKQGKSVGFWTAAMLLAGYFMDNSNDVNKMPPPAKIVLCQASPGLNFGSLSSRPFGSCLSDAIAKQKDMYASQSESYSSNGVYTQPHGSSGVNVTYQFIYYPNPASSSGNGFSVIVVFPESSEYEKLSTVTDSDWNQFIGDTLSKVGYGDKPFTPNGQQYPVYPVDGQTWPTTVTPVTPPMTPNKPWPTPVPSPQPVPTPDNPTFPAVPDDAWKPFPLPDHTTKPVDPPVTNPGTEVKPLPDGGFVIPNPLPVTVDGPVDVNILNPLEQGLTLKQLTNYHDTAAGSLTEAPAIGTGDGISELGKAYDDLIKNKMNFSIPSLPSPYSYFNFDMGSCRLPSFSASILGDVKRIQVNSEFCTFYDGVGRPVVAWMFFMLTVLYIYLLTMRTVRAQ